MSVPIVGHLRTEWRRWKCRTQWHSALTRASSRRLQLECLEDRVCWRILFMPAISIKPRSTKSIRALVALWSTIPVAAGVDSLIFDSQNDIIYTAYGQGQLRSVNPAVGISSDKLIATVSAHVVDLCGIRAANPC